MGWNNPASDDLFQAEDSFQSSDEEAALGEGKQFLLRIYRQNGELFDSVVLGDVTLKNSFALKYWTKISNGDYNE